MSSTPTTLRTVSTCMDPPAHRVRGGTSAGAVSIEAGLAQSVPFETGPRGGTGERRPHCGMGRMAARETSQAKTGAAPSGGASGRGIPTVRPCIVNRGRSAGRIGDVRDYRTIERPCLPNFPPCGADPRWRRAVSSSLARLPRPRCAPLDLRRPVIRPRLTGTESGAARAETSRREATSCAE